MTSESIFGGFDGLVSVLGVIIGLAATSRGKIIDAAIGLAVASAISMAAGEYLGDDASNIKKAVAMGISTLAGTIIPILPFVFLPKVPAFIVAGVLVAAFGYLVSYARDKGTRGYIETYVILFASIAITIVVALITGAGG